MQLSPGPGAQAAWEPSDALPGLPGLHQNWAYSGKAFSAFLELYPRVGRERTHSKEGMSGVLQDPAFSDCVGNFIL